ATGVFVNAALQLCVVLGVAGLLVLLGRVLWSSVGQGLVGPDLPHGIRAGVAVGVVGCFLIGLFTRGIGASLESSLGDRGAAVGIPITLAIGIALLVAGAMLFFRAGFDRWLVTVEDQGWFGAAAYKRTQGQR